MNATSAMLLWGVLVLVFLLIEALTPQLLSIWFSVGALSALIAAALGAKFWLQIIVFLAVSVAVVFLMRPLSEKFQNRMKEKLNANRIIGRHGIVVQKIDAMAGTGQIRVGSDIWSAKSTEEEPIEEGRRVTVCYIEGVRAVVRLSSVQPEEMQAE